MNKPSSVSSSHPLRRIGMCVAALVTLVAALAITVPGATVTPALAYVHINLASSVPAKDSHVTQAPSEIRLTFSGTIDVTRAKLELLSADGKTVAVEPLRAVPDSVRVAVSRVTGNLAAG